MKIYQNFILMVCRAITYLYEKAYLYVVTLEINKGEAGILIHLYRSLEYGDNCVRLTSTGLLIHGGQLCTYSRLFARTILDNDEGEEIYGFGFTYNKDTIHVRYLTTEYVIKPTVKNLKVVYRVIKFNRNSGTVDTPAAIDWLLEGIASNVIVTECPENTSPNIGNAEITFVESNVDVNKTWLSKNLTHPFAKKGKIQ